MGRTKKELRKKGRHTEDQMKRALQLHRDGMSIRKAATECQLPYPTVRRYVIKYEHNKNIRLVPNYEINKVFTTDQELAYKEYITHCALLFYGLSSKQCRHIAYEMAKINNIKMPHSWEANMMAGVDWLRSFKKRHPELSLRKPEACSLSRATAFNKENVMKFYDNLKTALQRHPSFGDGTRLYNLDETSTTTVQRSQKVLAPKRVNIRKVTSGERGILVTTCCIINATGQALPPALIFPRKKYKNHMLNGAPSGTLGLANPSGWMNAETFIQVMKHFIKNTSASKDNPALLIMDNHESHLSIEALDLAKSSGVTVLTVHPHTTDKLQPLDVGCNAPFKSYYNAAIDSWLLRNPGKAVTIYNVAECVGQAYTKAMTPSNIINAFRKCGIHPYDNNLFTDEDFMPSTVTDRPAFTTENSTDAEDELPDSPDIFQISSQDYEDVRKDFATDENSVCNLIEVDNNKALSPETPPSTSHFDRQNFISPQFFRPPLKAGPRKRRSRVVGKSRLATDTPEKAEIENKKHKGIKRVKKQNIFSDNKKQRLQNQERKKKLVLPDSDTTDEEFNASGSSSGGEGFISDDDEEEFLSDDFLPLTANPNVGDYIIVMFASKKLKVYYVAIILEEIFDGDCDYYVSYLKLKSKLNQTFIDPLEPDSAGVKKEDIKYILPPPKIDGSSRRRATIRFPINMSYLNLRY